jgi:uncharacterized protein YbjT (DUF2867 family)
MKQVLVIGASGFVGRHIAQALLEDSYQVRCLARNPAKVQYLEKAGCEIVQGDISVPTSMQHALTSMDAVYISVHTLTTQNTQTAAQDFMQIELQGLQNIVTACRENGVHRLVYITSLGTAPDGASAWTRGRWQAEQLLLNSGLDVTIIRPGMIVGVGGQGFNMVVGNAKRWMAIVLGKGQKVFRCIAIDDLSYFLVGVLEDHRAYGQCYDVGNDDLLSNNQMIDVVADVIGRPHSRKLHISLSLLRVLAPLIERLAKSPKGAIKGMLDGIKTDMIGDPGPIRQILPRPLLSFRQAVERALKGIS